MPQFNINGPGSPSFILTSEKIETALTYKPGKQEDVEALQKTVASKLDDTALNDYTNNETLQQKLDAKADKDKVEALETTVNELDGTYAKKSDVASGVRWAGSVDKFADLNEKKETAQLGDLFNVQETDMNYVYNGSDFDAMAPMTDLSGYALKTYVDTETAKKANSSHSHQASEVQFSDGEDFQTKLDNGSLQGPAGPAGPAGSSGTVGPQGPSGPNLVDTTTTTTINGLLKGNGETVAQAADGTDYMSPTKITAAINEYVPSFLTLTLTKEGWTENAQSVAATGVLADETAQEIRISPKGTDIDAYVKAGIYCTGQSTNSLSFKCSTAPAANLTVYAVLQKVRKG